ncbi:MAG: DUF3472 domain-containing protein [Gemmatimonadales bacterium]
MIVIAFLAAMLVRTAPATPVELRVPAYTAYLAPDPDVIDVSPDRPVTPFVHPHARIAWYGHFAVTGTVRTTIDMMVPRGAPIRFRLTVGTEHRDASASGSNAMVAVSFGAFTVRDTGYVRFDLAQQDDTPAPDVAVDALRLDGAPIAAAHFNLDPRRNAASVHLRFPTDSNDVITGFYSEVTAVIDPVPTYYMACGFARGYFGMQVNSPTERRIIFSVWDAASGSTARDRSTVASENFTQLVAKGDSVVAEVFGNEGTGGHSHLVYPWKTGETQKFFVTAKPDGSFTTYTGYWFNPDRRAWQLIASFRAAKDGQGLRRLYSFSEDFGGSTGDQRRKALYGNQWIRLADGSWKELTTATFSHDATGKSDRLDRFMGVENGRFFLSHGGFVPGYTASGTAFTRPAGHTPPTIILP